MTFTTLITSAIILFIPSGQGECDSKTGGYYDIDTKTIYICTPVDRSYSFYLRHELGHYVWNTHMNQNKRNDYTKLYNKAIDKGSGSFYREYGMTDVEEDFSENFALMLMKEKHKFPLQYRINYIRKLFITL